MKVCPNCQSRFDQGEAYCPDDGTELVEAEELSPGRLAGRTLDETVELESLRRVDELGERYRGALVDPETPVDVTVFNQAANPVRDRLDELDATVDVLEKALPPQILSVHSIELDSDERYLVEQAADGEPLRELIDEEAPLDWREAIRLTARLAQALHWMAERGHIHRGLHPGAIHVDTDDNAVQVGDWLQSALTRHASPLEGAENGQAYVGFAAYMAPEAIEEDGDVDERSLVYSLGMLMYEMILGRPPFTADDTAELLKRQLHENPLELGVASDDEDLHPELDSILGMMWNKDPEERFQTPKAIVAALSSLVDDPPRELAPAPEVADKPIFETDIELPELDEDESGDDAGGDADGEAEADGDEEGSGGDTLMGISATDVKNAGPGGDAEETDESDDAGDDDADGGEEPADDIQAGEAAIEEDDGSDRERTSSADQPSIIIEDPELRSAMDEESTAEAADDESDEETPDESDEESASDPPGSDDEDSVVAGESEVSTDADETDDPDDEDSEVEASADSDDESIDAEDPDDEPASVEADDENPEASGDEMEADSGEQSATAMTVDAETASTLVLQRTETPSALLATGFRETDLDGNFTPETDASPVAAQSTHLLRDDEPETDDESAAWDELSEEIEQDDESEADGEAEDGTDDADEEASEESAEAEDEQQTTDEPETEESADRDETDTEPEEAAEETGDEAEETDEEDQAADTEPEEAEDGDEDDEEQADEEAADDEEDAADSEAADDREADEDQETDEDEQTADSDDEEADEDEEAPEVEEEEAQETDDEEDGESSVDASGEAVVVDSEGDEDESETDDEEPERAAAEDKTQAAAENEAEDAPELNSFEADGLPETDATDEWFEVDEKEAWRAADVREGRDRSEIIRKYATTAVWVVLVLAAVGLFVFAQTYEPADGENGGTNETQTSSE